MKTSRQIAYDTLFRVLKEGAYSNIAIDKMLLESGVDKTQASFATALFYGVLETKITLDYIIKYYVKKPLNKLDIEVLNILRMGIYQILFMDGVPDNSAVDECVKLTAYSRKASAKGFVNAVLRGFIRDNKQYKLPDIKKDEILHYSIKYACPQWILKQWAEQYGIETAIELAKSSLDRPPLTIRVNTLKTTSEKLIGYLENRGVQAQKHEYLENCLIINQSGSINKLPQYRQGLFYVQDVSSQLCAKAVDAKPGDIVIDMCAAPGSKSFTIAQYMNNEGAIYANDLFEHKLKLINDNAKRLGITVINTSIQDGAEFNPEIEKADRVLCDVPCSGLGIIRRKPEIKYKEQTDLDGLPDIQYKILCNASNYVKDGGYLIYSTCTTNKKENDEVVTKFLSNNNSYKPLQLSEKLSKIEGIDNCWVTLFPHQNNCDGFFISVLQKN